MTPPRTLALTLLYQNRMKASSQPTVATATITIKVALLTLVAPGRRRPLMTRRRTSTPTTTHMSTALAAVAAAAAAVVAAVTPVVLSGCSSA
jgi:hypothetical protein